MEVKRTGGRSVLTWVPRYPGIRNEPLDVRVYATAAMELVCKPEILARLARDRKAKVELVQVAPQAQSNGRAEMVEKPVRSNVSRGVRVVSGGMSWQ